jgi:hypothetical protein
LRSILLLGSWSPSLFLFGFWNPRWLSGLVVLRSSILVVQSFVVILGILQLSCGENVWLPHSRAWLSVPLNFALCESMRRIRWVIMDMWWALCCHIAPTEISFHWEIDLWINHHLYVLRLYFYTQASYLCIYIYDSLTRYYEQLIWAAWSGTLGYLHLWISLHTKKKKNVSAHGPYSI